MEYNIQLSMRLDGQSLQSLLRALDSGPHGLMRGIIDNIVTQCRMQEEELAKQQADAARIPTPETEPTE